MGTAAEMGQGYCIRKLRRGDQKLPAIRVAQVDTQADPCASHREGWGSRLRLLVEVSAEGTFIGPVTVDCVRLSNNRNDLQDWDIHIMQELLRKLIPGAHSEFHHL